VIDCQASGRAFYFHNGETKDCVIDNFTIQNGKVEDTGGGAILCENNSSPTITNCVFQNNEAVDTNGTNDSENGGAIYCDSSSPTIVNCAFSGNSAENGGAIYCNSSSPSITNCTFRGNSANQYGGALLCEDSSSLTVTNCEFSGNSAGSDGGAMGCASSSSTLNNCTFGGNSTSAIWCAAIYNMTLNNCILWDGGHEIYVMVGYAPTLNYCCVDPTGLGGVTLNNCIHADPQFVDAAGGDYHLKPSSPCIDAGNNTSVGADVTTDLDGNNRIVDGNGDETATVDIGAYEFCHIIYVDGVSGDDANDGLSWTAAKKTIQAGMNAASNWWLVLVADATYNETDLNFNGKKVYLKGVDHNNPGQQPVIDCGGSGRAFYFGSGETADSVIDNFVIKNGKVEDAGGGAVLCENNSSPTIKNCVFESNKAVDMNGSWGEESGGAIYCDSSSPTISNCTFSGNRATCNGGAVFCIGSGSPIIAECTFSGNSANYRGGAFYCSSGSPSIINCVFSGNSVNNNYGGAIYCGGSSLTVVNCRFTGNTANWDGGAIYCTSSSNPTITNCTFSGNKANGSGGLYGYGGAIYCDLYSNPTLNNCILWGNSAGNDGNEIYIKDSYSSCTLNYCCVNNTGYGGQTGNITENHCIHSDPQFVDPANGDYHLKDTSPCIDAGDNTLVPSGVDKDLDGNPRIVNGTVDIGAYEFQP